MHACECECACERVSGQGERAPEGRGWATASQRLCRVQAEAETASRAVSRAGALPLTPTSYGTSAEAAFSQLHLQKGNSDSTVPTFPVWTHKR